MMDTIHCHVDNLSRRKADGGERSAVAKAAYNAGTAIWNERENKVTNFGNRADVVHSELLAPAGAPAWARDRARLWNLVDMTARRKDARLAKTIDAAISREIPRAQWVALLHAFVAPYVAQGMVADVAIHDDGTGHNPHVHVLLTVRTLKPDGFGAKLTNVDQKTFVTQARTGWETISNKFLEAAGSPLRLDKRSHKARGIQAAPTKHRGPNPAERRLRRAEARQQRELTMSHQASEDDRRAYPLLTERDDWPPRSEEPARDMTHGERAELTRYWEERRAEAQQVTATEVRKRELAGWLDQKNDEATRRQQPAEPPEPWYQSALARARAEQLPAAYDRVAATETMRDFAADLAQRRSAYEQTVWERAVSAAPTREERELLAMAEGATPEVKTRLKEIVITERMRRIRAEDDAERLAEFEQQMDPSLRERLEDFVVGSRQGEPEYAPPEPGPDYEPTSPARLQRAQEKMIEEYERDEPDREPER
ncbi:hypothetical protein GGD81_004616 [Rhodobium orientis]|uniref:MobA/MobL protein domain-containing protein n=1 Tax=Rhodobium orientis TaxID=34017 RepID=A0A327JG48_9HYPH|nr:MobA/MobL family protein [Rhodobium orientis]MBB4305536.1 hypothetical protein [Rhodobium orientis]MBK5949132.1 hypothetical protein [Rhodobium orientis]RAI24676.1 hypothetical protein CH339_21620 [Rhodobium orientis]